MTNITKIKNAIKRKVNESRLRGKVSSILDDALPNILTEIDQLDQAFLDAKPVKEGGTPLQNKVYDAVTGMSVNSKDSFESKFAVKRGKLNDFVFRLSDRDATGILKLIKQRKFESIKELDVRKTHGDKRIENPATGNDIKLRTALKAKKGSAVYAKGKAMYNALKDTPANESVKSKLERLKELLGNDVNERAYASTDGKPTFDYDPGEDKLTEGVIGIKTDRDFKVKDLKTALDKAKIKYKMNRLSMTLMVLNLDKKYFKDAKKIIDDVGLSVMEAKESVTEGKLNEGKRISFRDLGISNLMDLKLYTDKLAKANIGWDQKGQALVFNNANDAKKARQLLGLDEVTEAKGGWALYTGGKKIKSFRSKKEALRALQLVQLSDNSVELRAEANFKPGDKFGGRDGDKDYKYKKYVAKAFKDIKDATFKFRNAMGVKQLGQSDPKVKKQLESLHKALFALEKDLKGKGLTESKINEAKFTNFKQYILKLAKEMGDRQLERDANNSSKLKKMFDRDQHYKIFKDNEVLKYDGKKLHNMIKYDRRFNEGKLTEVKIGDMVKIDKAYGGGKGEVKDKKGSFVVVNGSSYHESDVKVVNESKLTEAKIRKGDVIKMDDGEIGVVNKVSGRVAYIKLPSMPGSFHPIEAARVTYKGKHKGKDIYSETKGAPKGHYFTASGNVVKGSLSKAAKSKGARLSDPKDKQRSKVPPATQRNEEVNETKATKGQVTKAFSDISKLSVAMLLNIEKFKAAKAKGDEKSIDKHRKIAYDLQTKKKKMEATLEKMITGIDKDVELVIDEGKLK